MIAIAPLLASCKSPPAPTPTLDCEPDAGGWAVCHCPRCRGARRWPAYYAAPAAPPGAPFISYECYLESLPDEQAAYLPSSPSGLALRAIREGRIKLRRQRTHVAGERSVR